MSIFHYSCLIFTAKMKSNKIILILLISVFAKTFHSQEMEEMIIAASRPQKTTAEQYKILLSILKKSIDLGCDKILSGN